MGDYEPPSFSLGLDLGFDSEPDIAVLDRQIFDGAPDSSFETYVSSLVDDEAVGRPQIGNSNADIGVEPPRFLKRLKRGPPASSLPANKRESPPPYCLVDDDIEEFSSQEELPTEAHPSAQYHSVCSSSKNPLQGLSKNPPSSNLKGNKRKQVSNALDSSGLKRRENGPLFPNLTVSPLRRFQLLESDSDEPSANNHSSRKGDRITSISKEQQSKFINPVTSELGKEEQGSVSKNEDLWKDFSSVKKLQVSTPAFDELCEEFYQSGKDNCRDISNNNGALWNTANCPSAHQYYFHDDPRVQRLVHDRLPHFFPLGVVKNRVNQLPSTSAIDYMGQFSHGEASNGKASQKFTMKSSEDKLQRRDHESMVGAKIFSSARDGKTSKQLKSKGNGSKTRRKVSKKSNSEEALMESESWMNPNDSVSLSKDAGKRRVHASGQSDGHWYTSSDGRKVYVSKSGQELTGSAAYSHYKKERGGFKKSKNKATSKKRNKKRN